MIQSKKNSQAGNILIYIIGAIFLIGILTIMMKGSSTPGTGIDRETLILKAQKVRDYGAELERGVSYILRNGHSETEISFAHPNHSSTYGTYGTTPTAELFHPDGGGVEWRDNDTDIQTADTDWIFTGVNEVDGVGSTCASSSCSDLLALLPNISSDLCIYLNDESGVTNPSGTPPENAAAQGETFFAGSFGYSDVVNDSGNNLQYKPEGCFLENGSTTDYYYYKVLLAR